MPRYHIIILSSIHNISSFHAFIILYLVYTLTHNMSYHVPITFKHLYHVTNKLHYIESYIHFNINSSFFTTFDILFHLHAVTLMTIYCPYYYVTISFIPIDFNSLFTHAYQLMQCLLSIYIQPRCHITYISCILIFLHTKTPFDI